MTTRGKKQKRPNLAQKRTAIPDELRYNGSTSEENRAQLEAYSNSVEKIK